MRSRGTRTFTCAAVLMVIAGLTGCSGGGSDEPEATPTPTEATAEDLAIATVQEYWDERVRVESSADYASADFEGILDPALLEGVNARYSSYADGGFRREGEPELRDFEATVDGSTALVTVCVNEGGWTAVADIENVEQPADEFYAIAYPLKQAGDDWIITTEGQNPPEGVSC